MTSFDLKLPDRGDEPLTIRAIHELVDHLDGEDRAVTTELLTFAWNAAGGDGRTTTGQVAELLEGASRDELAVYLDASRAAAGLPTRAQVHYEEERRMRVPSDDERPRMVFEGGRWREETTAPRIGYSPSGSLIDLDEADQEAARVRAVARSRERQAKDEHEQRQAEAAPLVAHQQAVEAELDGLLPPGF